MGPRSFDRGKRKGEIAYTWWSPLQWGRDLSIAESACATPPWCGISVLQWGRDLSIAESLTAGRKE